MRAIKEFLMHLAVELRLHELALEGKPVPPNLQKGVSLYRFITIDVMGCQKEIARDIVEGGGEFVLALKKTSRSSGMRSKTTFSTRSNATLNTSAIASTKPMRPGMVDSMNAHMWSRGSPKTFPSRRSGPK